MSKLQPFTRAPGGVARPIVEPITPPRRPVGTPRHKVSCTLDHERYVEFKRFAAEHGLSGDEIMVVAIDRLMRS